MEPFTTAEHESLRARAQAFARAQGDGEAEVGAAPALVRALGDASLLVAALPDGAGAKPGALPLVVLRETLARASGLLDALAAVQALAALPIAAAGTDAVRRRWLPGLRAGTEVGAFALTEVGAGSDLGALAATARREGGGYRLDGDKTLISNAGLASVYVVFARTGGPGDARPLSAFAVPADAPGLSTQPIALSVAHPIGAVRLRGVRVDENARLGAEGDGLRLALSTLAFMRPTVGAAACGMAARALDEAAAFARGRQAFGQALIARESVRMALGDMATSLEAARLLVYRAAWQRDRVAAEGGDERAAAGPASMAKLFATEAAQVIVDRAVQIHGGQGVVRGAVVERLYREVRALRIYEGASEIQKLVIADALWGR